MSEGQLVEVHDLIKNYDEGQNVARVLKGVELTIQGNRAKDPKLKVVKAARIIIKGQTYNLYPARS